MKFIGMEPIPAGDNPFNHDPVSMGLGVDKDIVIMYMRHEGNQHITIVDTKTGQRAKVVFDRPEVPPCAE
jgi:hypothetical protein